MKVLDIYINIHTYYMHVCKNLYTYVYTFITQENVLNNYFGVYKWLNTKQIEEKSFQFLI